MRYRSAMEIRDILVANLKLAIHHHGGIPQLAAKCSAGSIKYFEQIISGFQGPKDKSPRSPGATVSAAVAAAMGKPPQWMYEKHEEEWAKLGAINEAEKTTGNGSLSAKQIQQANQNVAGYVTQKTERERDIDDLLSITERISDRGLAALLFSARQVAEQFPKVKQTPKSSA